MGIEKDLMIEEDERNFFEPLCDAFDEVDDLHTRANEFVEEAVRDADRILRRLINAGSSLDEHPNPEFNDETILKWEKTFDEVESMTNDINLIVEGMHDELTELLEYDRYEWERKQEQAVLSDADERQYSASEDSGWSPEVDKLDGKLFSHLKVLDATFEKVRLEIPEQLNKKEEVGRIEARLEQLRTVRVYRLIRPDEDPGIGLYAKDPGSDVSAEIFLERGSYGVQSKYISTSKAKSACLFYASKAIHERGASRDDLRIATIDLNIEQCTFDLQNPATRRDLGIWDGTVACNYAKKFEEVLVDVSISSEEVVRVENVPPGLPLVQRGVSLNTFRNALRLEDDLASALRNTHL